MPLHRCPSSFPLYTVSSDRAESLSCWRLTLTLCMLMRFPQLSRYCLRSLSWKRQQPQCSHFSISILCVCVIEANTFKTPACWTVSVLTRYSNTRVRQRSVWMMSCSVTMLACLRFFSRDTGYTEEGQANRDNRQNDLLTPWSYAFRLTMDLNLCCLFNWNGQQTCAMSQLHTAVHIYGTLLWLFYA